MTASANFLDRLRREAEEAQHAETAYRREAEVRIAMLAEARAFAFRRAHFLAAMNEAVRAEPKTADEPDGQAAASAEEAAVAQALALTQTRLGWVEVSAAAQTVLTRLAPVAAALFRASLPLGQEDGEHAEREIEATLETFEAWYAKTYGVVFWSLFEIEIPETPLVDF